MPSRRMSASYGWYPPPHHLGYFGPGPVGLAAGGWGLRGGINKGRGHRGRRHGPVQDRQGDFSQPSLNQLRKQNRHKAKKHYKDFGSTPRSVPPAPDVTGSFLLPEGSQQTPSGLHTQTPVPATYQSGTAWKNGFGAVDKDTIAAAKEAGIDIYGSNVAGDWFEEAIDFTDSEDEMDTQTANNKVEQQQALITELEENNINLQERVFLLEQELKELKAKMTAMEAAHSKSAKEHQQHDDEGGASSGREENEENVADETVAQRSSSDS